MASQITANLPALDFPKEVDYPTQEDWAAFSAAAEENFGILGGGWSTQMQLWKDQANAMSTELNNNSTIAQSVANYQGDWVSQGYTLGQTVSVSEIYYVCKLTHATGQNPTDGGSLYWNLVIGNWDLKADKTEVSLKVDKNMSAYTTKTTPVDDDLFPLSDSASTFGIKKLSWANLKATLKTYFDTLYSKLTPTIATGTAIFTKATNNINITNIGVGIDVGDVISISGSTNNNMKFTVEVITDNNNIIVNQAHAGKSRTVAPIGTRALIDETANVTIKLLAKYYNASAGLGQGWVNVTGIRTIGTNYTNNTNREIDIMYTATQVGSGSSYLSINSEIALAAQQSTISGVVNLTFSIEEGNTYNINGSNTKLYWWEKR